MTILNRLLGSKLSRNRPFCLFGAKGVGKTTLVKAFSANFSNWIHLDLETPGDRAMFDNPMDPGERTKAISFLKGKEIRGKGTLIVLDEIGQCSPAISWVSAFLNQRRGDPPGHPDGPFVIATSSFFNEDLSRLTNLSTGLMTAVRLHPFSFEEFLEIMDEGALLEALREVPVPYYAYEKLLAAFHLYALLGGMPVVAADYGEHRHLSGLRKHYEQIEQNLINGLNHVTAGSRSLATATDVLQNVYPFAATRVSLSRFGNIDKGSRAIGRAFFALEQSFVCYLVYPVTSTSMTARPSLSKFPRLHLLDTGLVNYFSGIQKHIYGTHDMNPMFEGQIARQAVWQELIAAAPPTASGQMDVSFWIRDKPQSKAEVDFIIPVRDQLIPVVVRSGEPGRLRSLHQFMDIAPHPFAVRLSAGKLAGQQTQTIRGKKFYLLNLPYFLAGKVGEHLDGFMRLAGGAMSGQ